MNKIKKKKEASKRKINVHVDLQWIMKWLDAHSGICINLLHNQKHNISLLSDVKLLITSLSFDFWLQERNMCLAINPFVSN